MSSSPADPAPASAASAAPPAGSQAVASPAPTTAAHHSPANPVGRDLAVLSLGALGVVFGDIGTSPLYAMRQCFIDPKRMAVNEANVLGVVSLVFWALVLIVVVKYLSFIMRADNKGEGGILALCALIMKPNRESKLWLALPLLVGLFGAGLLYGDGAITPAISILGAIEGIKVATHTLDPVVVPLAVAILIALFAVQRFGTGRIGTVFGWVMLLWFSAIAVAGSVAMTHAPEVLRGLSPTYAVEFFVHNGLRGFLLLGSVVLVVTGGEALYADMGHFGRKPIRLAWYLIVMPALMLNYLGQGALLLTHGQEPAVRDHLFYALTPGWTLYPMVVLATMAAIIASQALITGAFSLTRGAVQLGYFPRVRIVHTSGENEGQIYIPEINWILMVMCVTLVLAFRNSDRMAAAYGIAVTGTMAITSYLFYGVARTRWGWSRLTAGSLVALFLALDLALFSANLEKIAEGGWCPLAIGGLVFTIMTTWRRGRRELARVFAEGTLPDALFLADVEQNGLPRVKGTAVFMTSNSDGIPPVLLHHVKHNKVLHEQVVLLSIGVDQVPQVPLESNWELRELGQGFYRVSARYGFMQTPNVPRLLARCREAGLTTDPDDTSFFLGRETLLMTGHGKMARWRKGLFAFLSRNSRSATMFFDLPPNRVVELGAQIEL